MGNGAAQGKLYFFVNGKCRPQAPDEIRAVCGMLGIGTAKLIKLWKHLGEKSGDNSLTGNPESAAILYSQHAYNTGVAYTMKYKHVLDKDYVKGGQAKAGIYSTDGGQIQTFGVAVTPRDSIAGWHTVSEENCKIEKFQV